MAISRSTFDPFAFWTPERIINTIHGATAADLPCTDYIHTSNPSGPAGVIRGPTDHESVKISPAKPIVSTDVLDISRKSELTSFPYHSIGRLFVYGSNATKDSDGREIVQPTVKCATAFYIGNSELLTVAHAFNLQSGGVSFKETHGSIFIPAMIDENDQAGENYGVYFINPGRYLCHPNYNPNHDRLWEGIARYDVCKVFVGPGIKSNGEVIGSIEDANLRPLTVLKDYGERFRHQTTWRVFGYPRHHANGRLIGVKGEFYSWEGAEVKMHTPAEVLVGMAGGPWMLEPQGPVLGVQAVQLRDKAGSHFAISPYLSADFLEN